jgi:hypothetical protein
MPARYGKAAPAGKKTSAPKAVAPKDNMSLGGRRHSRAFTAKKK